MKAESTRLIPPKHTEMPTVFYCAIFLILIILLIIAILSHLQSHLSSQTTLQPPPVILPERHLAPSQDLVRRMLHVDPNRRLSASQVLQHAFIARPDQLPEFHLAQNKDYKSVKGAMSAMFRWGAARS